MSNFFRISHTQKSLKSVNFWQSYLKKKKVDVFWGHSVETPFIWDAKQNTVQMSSWIWIPTVMKIGRCLAELFNKKIKINRMTFLRITVYNATCIQESSLMVNGTIQSQHWLWLAWANVTALLHIYGHSLFALTDKWNRGALCETT